MNTGGEVWTVWVDGGGLGDLREPERGLRHLASSDVASHCFGPLVRRSRELGAHPLDRVPRCPRDADNAARCLPGALVSRRPVWRVSHVGAGCDRAREASVALEWSRTSSPSHSRFAGSRPSCEPRASSSTPPSTSGRAASLGRSYEHSVIAHKLYEKGRVPQDDEILRDLEAVLIAYDRYIENRPTTEIQAESDQANAFLIYVGGGSETNLRVGLEQGVWGFPASSCRSSSLRVGDLVVFASGYTGGSPRVPPEEWTNHSVRRARTRTGHAPGVRGLIAGLA